MHQEVYEKQTMSDNDYNPTEWKDTRDTRIPRAKDFDDNGGLLGVDRDQLQWFLNPDDNTPYRVLDVFKSGGPDSWWFTVVLGDVDENYVGHYIFHDSDDHGDYHKTIITGEQP